MPSPESAPVDQPDDLLAACEPIIAKLVAHRLARWPADVHDDVAQACRVHLWRYALPRYDPARGPLDAFVRLVCNRVIYTEAQKLDANVPLAEAAADDDQPAAPPDIDDQLARLRDALGDSLTKSQQTLLRLLLAGSCSRGIADELGITPASASQAIGRLRRKIYPYVVEVAA